MQLTKWVCLGCLLFLLTSCVRVTENAPDKGLAANVDNRTDAATIRDLRVAAIEFNSKQFALDDGHLELLVVIENRGDEPESSVPVRVVLTDDADQVVLDATEYAMDVARRDTAIIRFEGNLSGTLKPRYQLRVEVGSVPDETNISNNVRVYDVAISEP